MFSEGVTNDGFLVQILRVQGSGFMVLGPGLTFQGSLRVIAGRVIRLFMQSAMPNTDVW